jgi:hypothetical protein
MKEQREVRWMIRKALEKSVGPVTDVEWKRVCRIATLDIMANHWVFRQRTSRQYLERVLATSINLVRRYHHIPTVNN